MKQKGKINSFINQIFLEKEQADASAFGRPIFPRLLFIEFSWIRLDSTCSLNRKFSFHVIYKVFQSYNSIKQHYYIIQPELETQNII